MKVEKIKSLNQESFHKYIISIVVVIIATFIQYFLWDYIQPAPYLIYYPAVILACLYGHGLTAILLSTLCVQYAFIQPFIDFSFTWPHDIVRHLAFFVSTLGIKILVDRALTSKKQAEFAVTSLKEEKVLREMFVSTLSHDLQTPLTAIKLSTGILIRHPDNDPKKHYDRILSNTIRIENMIRNLLDSNQITAGKPLPVTVEEMELVEVANKTIEELKNIYGDRFILKYPHELTGHWSPDAIQRILENLCSNAIKYGDEEKPITVELTCDSASVTISVHNWGHAIDQEAHAVLFDTFLRLKSARNKSIKGWGLGLALVKGLTEAMGGSVGIMSTEEAGTKFTVNLPWHVTDLTNQNPV